GSHQRPVPPEVSRFALFLRLSRLPEFGRPDQDLRAAQAGGDDRSPPDVRLPTGARAIDVCDRSPPSAGKVLCRVIRPTAAASLVLWPARRRAAFPRPGAARLSNS